MGVPVLIGRIITPVGGSRRSADKPWGMGHGPWYCHGPPPVLQSYRHFSFSATWRPTHRHRGSASTSGNRLSSLPILGTLDLAPHEGFRPQDGPSSSLSRGDLLQRAVNRAAWSLMMTALDGRSPTLSLWPCHCDNLLRLCHQVAPFLCRAQWSPSWQSHAAPTGHTQPG